MAYRFLLGVPASLAEEANIAISEAGDAQVVVSRNSHGLGFDDPYVDLTIAAHTLRVIHTIYDWYESLPPPRPEMGLVLYNGQRLALDQLDRGSMVAAIRRDQPWVERTVPHLGDHLRDAPSPRVGTHEDASEGGIMSATPSALVDQADAARAGTAQLERSWRTLPAAERATRAVAVQNLNHIAIRVTEIAKAERFYVSFLGMDVVARGRRTARGGFEPIEPGSGDRQATTNAEADVSFLRNGPLVLALHRLGRGARIERDVLDHVSLRVDLSTFRQLKGEALARPLEVVASTEGAFAFRDPFAVTWEITTQGLPGFLA